MASLVYAGNTSAPRGCWVNAGPSSVITNNTAETAFDQVFTFPAQAQRYIAPTSILRLRGYGLISTGLLNTGCTLRLRWGGVSGTLIASTGGLTLAISQSNAGWYFNVYCRIDAVGSPGAMEAQGNIQFESGLLTVLSNHLTNTTTMVIDTAAATDIALTAQWGTAQASNQISIRAMTVEIDGP